MNAIQKIAIAVALSLPMMAGAQTINQASLTVNVSLTAQCKVKTNAPGTGITYSAFTTADVTGKYADVTYECTRGITLSNLQFDSTAGNNTSSASTTPSATATGVVAGLKYDLNTGNPTRAAGTVASASSIGSGDTVAYAVTYTIPKDQAGEVASGNSQSVALARTLTLVY